MCNPSCPLPDGSPQLLLDGREVEHNLVMKGTNISIEADSESDNDNDMLLAGSTSAKPTPTGCVTDVPMHSGGSTWPDPSQEATLKEPEPEAA